MKKSLVKMIVVGLALIFGMEIAANAGDEPYSHPWRAGDLIVNMNGNDVNAARADASGFDPLAPSSSTPIFTKSSFVAGHTTQRDPNVVSDIFITAPGDDSGTLYRANLSDGSVDPLNTSLAADPDNTGNLGITSDGSFLYISDGDGNIDRYNF